MPPFTDLEGPVIIHDTVCFINNLYEFGSADLYKRCIILVSQFNWSCYVFL